MIALKKLDAPEAVNMSVHSSIEAALLRVAQVGFAKTTVLDLISAAEWREMDSTNDNICVEDTDDC